MFAYSTMSYAVFTILLFSHATQCVRLGSRISTGGVRGVVTTYAGLASDTTFLSVHLSGLRRPHRIEIRENRVLYNVPTPCTDTLIGKRINAIERYILPNGQKQVFHVRCDPRNLEGRSIVFIESGSRRRICSTIEYDTHYVTAEAKFLLNIGGKIVFREAAHSGTTTMYSNLFKTSELNPKPSIMIWQIVKARKNLHEHVCQRPRRHKPIARGKIPVGAHKDDYVTTAISMSLPLKRTGSIINRYVLLRKPNGKIVSCARIRQIKPNKATASWFNQGVKGGIGFLQDSEYDLTHVLVDLKHLNNTGSGYHIHEWPVPVRLVEGEQMCSPGKVSGHFNPFNVDAKSSPPPGTGTEDEYEVGDLSGKFGKLPSCNTFYKRYTDNNLPLFGKYSVVGRSIVIHRADGSRWICSTIVPQMSVIRAVATFKSSVIGQIVLTQDAQDRYADTQVSVELNYANGITSQTVDHPWHVHQNAICSNFNNKNCSCSAAGGHYNPFDVELKGDYKTQCSFNNPLRCEMGDQAGKNGKLSVRANDGDYSRFFYTDENLQLSGPYTIIGRSVVIHDADSGAGRLACANFERLPARILKVDRWYSMSSSNVIGNFRFIGNVEKYPQEVTLTKLRLRGLARRAGGFHVHKYPVAVRSLSPCAPQYVGGHFNPFNVDAKQSPPAGIGTHDQYEVGDLSGKYGNLLAMQRRVYKHGVDNFLPVRGPLSITGRSLVIHNKDGSRWTCGDIVENTRITKAKIIQARATFFTGPVRGYIQLSQYKYPDGSLSDTTILMELQGNTTTTCHNWHVHENLVRPEGDSHSGCLSAGPHYNPYNVNVKTGYAECKFDNPWRCELGDSSGKHGCIDMDGVRRFYTDVNLPLVGRFGVIGRSFVIHVADKGAARYSCANIRAV